MTIWDLRQQIEIHTPVWVLAVIFALAFIVYILIIFLPPGRDS